jgi:hypothetical protein
VMVHGPGMEFGDAVLMVSLSSTIRIAAHPSRSVTALVKRLQHDFLHSIVHAAGECCGTPFRNPG